LKPFAVLRAFGSMVWMDSNYSISHSESSTLWNISAASFTKR